MNPSNAGTQLEQKKIMKEVRDSKTIFSDEDYRNHSFVNGDQKEELIDHLSSLRPSLIRLEKLDHDTKKISIQLGRRGLELLEALDEINKTLKKGKISKKKYIRIQLGFNSSRFYEAVAMANAVKAGASEELHLTKLQILGSALNSLNGNRQNLATSCIQENKLPNGLDLKSANVEEFNDAFRATKHDVDDFCFTNLIKATKKISTDLKSFLVKQESSEVSITEEMFCLKNELLALSDLIAGYENVVSPKVQLH